MKKKSLNKKRAIVQKCKDLFLVVANVISICNALNQLNQLIN